MGMSEDNNVPNNDERHERPSSGWQSASERRAATRRGYRDEGYRGDRNGGRGESRRWDERRPRRDYEDRRRDERGERRWDRDSRRWEDRDRRGYRGESGREARRWEDRGRRDHDNRRNDRNDRGYRDDRGYRGGRGYRDEGYRGDRNGGGGSQRRDPVVPESVSARDLDAESRRRLASLSKDNADRVARHLVYAGSMMDVDPELSYEHARAACRSAARIDIVREALGLSAYLTGRYSEALRELRTFRRMTDDYAHAAIEADSERGLGRPEKALAFISEIPLKRLDPESRIELALVTSGARADAGDSEGGLAVLEKINVENLEQMLRARIELIRADRYDELGRDEEAAELRSRWEPVFAQEGRVDVYDSDDEDAEVVGEPDGDAPAQADGEAPAPGPEAEEDAPEVPEEGLGGAGTEDGEDSGEDPGEGAARIGDDGGETTPLDGGETGDVTAGDVDGDADEAPGADRTGEAAPDGEPNETEDAADGEAE